MFGARADGRRWPAPGRMLDLGTHRLHARIEGSGEPVIIFEAPLGGSHVGWCLVEPEIRKHCRTFAYDRAGFGWSDAGPGPRDAETIVSELRRALDLAGERGPFIFVGHSFGGLVGRLFASRNPELVAGLVLVDAPDPAEWLNATREHKRKLQGGALLCGIGAWIARLGIARFVAWLAARGSRKAAHGTTRVVSLGILSERESSRILAPLEKVPPELRPPLKAFWTQPKFYQALGSQISNLQRSCEQVLREARHLGDMPVLVLTAAAPTPERIAQQERVMELSRRGKHIVAPNCGHWIQLDQPGAVVEAVCEVLKATPTAETRRDLIM